MASVSSRKRSRLMVGDQGGGAPPNYSGFDTEMSFASTPVSASRAPPSSTAVSFTHSPTFVDPNMPPPTTASPSSSYQTSPFYRTPPMPASSPQQRQTFTSGMTYAIPPPIPATVQEHGVAQHSPTQSMRHPGDTYAAPSGPYIYRVPR